MAKMTLKSSKLVRVFAAAALADHATEDSVHGLRYVMR